MLICTSALYVMHTIVRRVLTRAILKSLDFILPSSVSESVAV